MNPLTMAMFAKEVLAERRDEHEREQFAARIRATHRRTRWAALRSLLGRPAARQAAPVASPATVQPTAQPTARPALIGCRG